MTDRVIIIGSGLAGFLCLRALRDQGDDRPVELFTMEAGDFYSKPLLSAAMAQGKTPEQLVTLSRSVMEEKHALRVHAHTAVVSIDRSAQTITTESGQQHRYADLILACGASPIHLGFEGSDHTISINTLADYQQLRDRLTKTSTVVILGGGLVGTEFACDLSAAGHAVSVVHDQAHPVNQLLPEAMGSVLAQAISEQLAVQWHFGVRALGVDASADQYQVHLDSGATLTADLVISAIGLRPNVALAKAAGLSVNRGIVVNLQGQTDDPHIYALGDCAEVNGQVHFYVPRLRECADIIAKKITGTHDQIRYPAMPVLLKTPPCRVAVFPPPLGIKGQWDIQGSGMDLEAVFYDVDNQSIGCAFSGKAMMARPKWQDKMPSLF